MARRPLPALALCLLAPLAAACAEVETPPPSTPAKAALTAAPSATAPVTQPMAPGHVARAEVERVLRQGPPWLLRRVVPEEVIRNGKFIGWRILSMPDDWGIDLKSGDIVTRVNGLSIESPDELWAAWMQVGTAPELRIAYERDGAARETVLAIDGPSGAGGGALKDEPPPPPKKPSRWQTIVIEGDDSAAPAEPQE